MEPASGANLEVDMGRAGKEEGRQKPVAAQRCGVEQPPVWDEQSRRFWCPAGVNAYDLPDGREWQRVFQGLIADCLPQQPRSLFQPSAVDAVSSASHCRGGGRPLARFPSDPDKWRMRAARTTALLQMPQRAGIEVMVQGRVLALFRFGGRIFAVEARCPHQGARLCEGEVGDIEDMVDGHRCYVVRCPVHKMLFDLETGEVLEGDCRVLLRTYAVRIGEADNVRRVAMIEVGFESLAPEYFEDGEEMDVT